MASAPETSPKVRSGRITQPPNQQRSIELTGQLENQETEKHADIERAEQGGVVALPSDLPAVIDIHGDVIKADWHEIRAKANEAEEYEHSLGIWQAIKTYKKVLPPFHCVAARGQDQVS